MFDLIYYRYILRLVKNALSPDIDYTIYNNQQTREIKKKTQEQEEKEEINNYIIKYLSISYEYLINYINEFINYFNIDISKFNKINQNKFYVLTQ